MRLENLVNRYLETVDGVLFALNCSEEPIANLTHLLFHCSQGKAFITKLHPMDYMVYAGFCFDLSGNSLEEGDLI